MSFPPFGSVDAVSDLDTGFRLVIDRGVTRFPVRPILGNRFLIGAGSNCHLQLAGDMPMLHSVLLLQDGQLWIDAVTPLPQLVVNGQALREGEIRVGDVIQIGEFVFTLDFEAVSKENPVAEMAGFSKPAQEWSAAELLDHLENEMEDLNRFEAGQRQAAKSMLDAVARQFQTETLTAQPDPRSEILKLLGELHERSQELEQRNTSLNIFAQKLAASHRELCEQLEVLQKEAVSPLGDADSEWKQSA